MQELMKLKEMLKQVDDIFLRKEISTLTLEDKLIDDLGLDSLGRVSLFHEINFELDKDNPETDAQKWETVGDVCHYIKDNQ